MCKPTPTESFQQYFDRQGFKYFKARELTWYFSRVRNGVRNSEPPREIWHSIIPTFRILDKLREKIGRPIIISSTYRSPAYNRTVGSTNASQHVRFTAVDFSSPGATPAHLHSELLAMRNSGEWVGGLGRYRTFVHIDTRGRNATW